MKYPKKRITTLQELLPYEETLISLMDTHRSMKEIISVLFTSTKVLDEYASVTFGQGTAFEEVLESFYDRSNHKLVSKEYEIALEGNVKMLQFLGKNYAKQTDDSNVSAMITEQVVLIDDYTKEDAGTTEEIRDATETK